MKGEVLGKLITLATEQTDPGFEQARDLARAEARRIDPQAMLLSWHSSLTGEFYPKIECGRQDRPSWIVWAASRGANLTVAVNDGSYVFYYLIQPLGDSRNQRNSRSMP
ncbi:MAG: hypothetical protein AMJ54_11260 [Deltaproteobacteria bacterium SG8_13]|nr:MAG: hypothetical protein AMJ54_11260 [Deltaproteobacteria bacterium SG8_13]